MRLDSGSDIESVNEFIGLHLIRYLGPCSWCYIYGVGPFPSQLDLSHLANWTLFFPADCSPLCEVSHLSFSTVLDQTPQVNSSHVCFVLDSEPTYMDPLADYFPHSEVQRV